MNIDIEGMMNKTVIESIGDVVITEKRSRDVISVDVQPVYEDSIYFDFNEYGNFLLENRKILYFYNGTDSGISDDTKESIIDMWEKYNPEVAEKLYSSETVWIDKGYGFFRSWMDMGADEGFIQQAIRYMTLQRVHDSRDIPPEEWQEAFPEHYDDDYDPLSIPNIPIEKLRLWGGSYLTGGGRNECLKEVQIWMNAFNMNYTLVEKFIYG